MNRCLYTADGYVRGSRDYGERVPECRDWCARIDDECPYAALRRLGLRFVVLPGETR